MRPSIVHKKVTLYKADFNMIKTTVYLDEHEFAKLKEIASGDKRHNLAALVRQAIKNFIGSYKKPTIAFAFTRKLLKQKARRSSFGDPVAFQRKLREEWR